MIEYNVQPYRRVGTFEIVYFEQEGRPIVKPTYAGLADTLDFAGIRKATPKSFSCTAWHVALDDIHSIVPWRDTMENSSRSTCAISMTEIFSLIARGWHA